MTQFKFDPAHSNVEFSIKHLAIANVKGRFNDFDADIQGELNDLSTLKGQFTIQINSIDTRIKDRDNHLLSSDFFDAEQYPEMTFEIKEVSEDKVTGDVTLKGETHEETFDLHYEGISKNPMNDAQTAGFVINGTLDRDKYGITFNQQLETGGLLLGKNVQFELSAEFEVQE